MLVTPLCALCLPVFVFTNWSRERGLRALLGHGLNLVIFGLVALAVYAPFILHFWHDYWEGGRGLLHAPRQPWDASEQAMRSVRFFSSTALPWLGLGFAGMLSTITRRNSVAVGTLLAAAVAAVWGERFLDVPVQLPQLCLFAIMAVLVVDQIPNKKVVAWVFVAIWAIASLPNYLDQRDEIREKVRLAEAYRAMAAQTPRLMVIGLGDSWIDGLQFERIVYHHTKLGLGLDFRQFGGSSRSIAQTRKDYAIWLMAPSSPGLMNPLTRNWRPESRSILGRRYEVWLPLNQ
jgi:hypothetical protein